MYLLYVDDSGDVDDPNVSHFVLGGIAIHERAIHWIGQELDEIAARFDAADPQGVELHGNPMVQGSKAWRTYSQNSRITAIQDCLRAFTKLHSSNRAFAVVVEKNSVSAGDPVEFAFEQLVNRFDRYLGRLHRQGDAQRGLLVFDKSTYENRFQGLARSFKNEGHRWGKTRNIAEVPMFVDSKATRLIQLADLIAYSVFRYYERQDNRFYPLFTHRFDRDGQQVHGLLHWRCLENPLQQSITTTEVILTSTEVLSQVVTVEREPLA